MPRSALYHVWALCFDSDLFTYISHVPFVALHIIEGFYFRPALMIRSRTVISDRAMVAGW